MCALVRLRVPRGVEVELAPGDIIGRIPCAVLQIDDPRISEAHAFISLRGAALKMMALRGRMSVDGKPRADVDLHPGLRIVLAGFFPIEVVATSFPEQQLAIARESEDGTQEELVAAQGTWSVFEREDEPLVHGYHPEAQAVVWSGADGVTVRTREQLTDHRLIDGDRFTVGAFGYRIVRVPTALFEASHTVDRGVCELSLRVRLYFDAVHISANTGRMVVITGIAANTVCELAEIGQPVAWQEVAKSLWSDASEASLRSRWDQLLARIRAKLRAAGLRSDLVRASGDGLVQLVVGPHDVIEWADGNAPGP